MGAVVEIWLESLISIFTMGWPLCALLPTAGLWESNLWGASYCTCTIIFDVNPVAMFLEFSSSTMTTINYMLYFECQPCSNLDKVFIFAQSCASYFLSQSVRSLRGGGAYFSNKTRPMYQGCIIEMRCTGILANNGIFKKARILIYLRNKTFSFICQNWLSMHPLSRLVQLWCWFWDRGSNTKLRDWKLSEDLGVN